MVFGRSARMIYLVAFPLGILVIALASSLLLSRKSSQTTSSEILIALKPEAISNLNRPEQPDPLDTGIPSLDSLNRKWGVYQMIRVFSGISPDDELADRYGLTGIYRLVILGDADLAAMIRDYQSDPHIDYAELNQIYEIK